MRRIPWKMVTMLVMAGMSCRALAGDIVLYGDRADFNDATGTRVVEDFTDTSHFPITSGVLNDQTSEAGLNPGDIQSGATYSTPIGQGFFFNIDSGGGFQGGFLDRLGPGEALTVDFDDAVGAIGFDTNFIMGQSFDITIVFSDNSMQALTRPVVQTEALAFFGFVSSAQDIASVVIAGDSPNFSFAVDNFTFETQFAPRPPPPTPVPPPPSRYAEPVPATGWPAQVLLILLVPLLAGAALYRR